MATKASAGGLDGFFKLSERGTNVRTELAAGVATFLVMAYIIFLNPLILTYFGDPELSAVAPPFQGLVVATCVVAGIGCLLFGLWANYPFAIAPGLGLNAVVAFQLVLGNGLSWQEAMGVIFLEGVLITILVLTGLRSAVMNAVPLYMKHAIGVGIGLFILFIGLVNGGFVVVGSGTPVTLGDFNSLPFFTFIVGLLLMIALVALKVRGALLIGILLTTAIATALNYAIGGGAAFSSGATIPPLSSLSFSLDFSTFGAGLNLGVFTKLPVIGAVLTIFALMIADFFDTMGTLIGVGDQAGFLDEKGQYPEGDLQKLLVVDSLGAVMGGLFGSSSATTYIESAAGVTEGGRTGLTAVVVGVFFLLSMFLAPFVGIVPAQATAPALVLVGFFMMTGVKEIDFSDIEQGFPAMLVMMVMPFTYSITNGIGIGFIAYTFIKVVRGKASEVHPMMWGASIAFLLYFLAGIIQGLVAGG